MYWMFIVNELVDGETVVSAQSIADYLIGKHKWQYTSLAPNLKKIAKGDQVLVYFAGKGRRYFYASFIIQGSIETMEKTLSTEETWQTDFNKMFKLVSPIDQVQIFKKPIHMDEVLRNKLTFIGDKKNWGLYFRQGIRSLPEQDFLTIMDNIGK